MDEASVIVALEWTLLLLASLSSLAVDADDNEEKVRTSIGAAPAIVCALWM